MDKPEFKPADHLANERTFLAWVRTGIGIMGLGFVVAKFSLFVSQLGLALGKNTDTDSHGYSRLIGIVLVLLGTASILLAFFQYHRTEKELRSGLYQPVSWLANILTAILVLISLLLVVYLLQSVYG
ncbi:MAG TPA: DUF202 domain-containing protein [Dyadobacter sp.]|jgi:putative membrane protein|nr:DUF202 domain-containing protein [Dyadobacter sp.]